MTNEELKERVDCLISLSDFHPSFLYYCSKYIKYIESYQFQIGLEESKTMLKSLVKKISINANERSVILMGALNELKSIKKSDSIRLTKLPIAHYIFARSICIDFLKNISPADFIDIANIALFSKRAAFRKYLSELFFRLKDSSDYFIYYPKFKQVLLNSILNHLLKPEDIKVYLGIVEYFEKDIEEKNIFLSLIDQKKKETVDSMKVFGNTEKESKLISITGSLSKDAVLALLKQGVSVMIKWGKSTTQEEKKALNAVIALCNALPIDPILDYLYDSDNQLHTIYCRTRSDIISAQKEAQSVLNVYTPDVLLRTAVDPYYESKLYGLPYKRDSILQQLKNNLTVLYENGIISLQTLNSYMTNLEREL